MFVLLVLSAVVAVLAQVRLVPAERRRRGVKRLTPWAAGVRRLGGVAVVGLGWLALIVVVDFGLGFAWTTWRGSDQARSEQVATVEEGQIARDPRADAPAYDDYPWAPDYIRELDVSRYEYRPFLIGELRPSRGEYINTGHGERASYLPEGAEPSDGLEVWFFGGSTMFGEGQRDEYTIPSQIARLAEQDGIVVRPVNMGHQGQLLWQEMLRLERELGRRSPPDLAVFYDGTNDFNYQIEDHRGQPTHGQLTQVDEQLSGSGQPVPRGLSHSPTVSIWDQYETTSLVGKVLSRLGIDSASAAAQARSGERDGISTDLVADVASTFARSVELVRVVAAEADVPVSFYWQPVRDSTDEYEALSAELPAGVVDLTHAFDGVREPIFVDGGHTNELGAEIVAEAMYETLGPELRSLARERGD